MISQNPLSEPPPSMTDSTLAAVLQDGWDLDAVPGCSGSPASRTSPRLSCDRYFLKVSNPAVSPEFMRP